jgi:hypothetical protein
MLVGGVPRRERTSLTRREPSAAWAGICIRATKEAQEGRQRWGRADRVLHRSVRGCWGLLELVGRRAHSSLDILYSAVGMKSRIYPSSIAILREEHDWSCLAELSHDGDTV